MFQKYWISPHLLFYLIKISFEFLIQMHVVWQLSDSGCWASNINTIHVYE